MTNDVLDELKNKFDIWHDDLEFVFDDGYESNPRAFYDDGAVHVVLGKFRFVFMKGDHFSGKMLKEKDVPKYEKIAKKIYAKIKGTRTQKEKMLPKLWTTQKMVKGL